MSTSEEFNVAMIFSGDNGVVLELKYSFSSYPLSSKYFSCAFFSDYPSEKECLFIGGLPTMIITNIINIKDNEINLKKYILALNLLNSILNAPYKPNKVDEKNNVLLNTKIIDLCCMLFKNHTSDSNDDKPPEYILNHFKRYCDNLKNVMIFGRILIKQNN